jgi:hypothetical protein
MNTSPVVGSLLGTFVTSSDVRAQKERLNPQVHALDAAIRAPGACPNLKPVTLDLWGSFVTAWDSFYAADDGFLTAGAEMDFALAQETELNGWRTGFAAACGFNVGPGNVTPGTVPTNPPLPAIDTSTKFLIGGGIALGLLLLLRR